MHALNNYLGGEYVIKEACDYAAKQVCAHLSQASGGDAEDKSRHLDPATGWLSIDVINYLGANLGIEVEPASLDVNDLLDMDKAACLLNCNNRHWTVLQQCARHRPWMHTNSIDTCCCIASTVCFHKHTRLESKDQLFDLLANIHQQYGGVSLHRIVQPERHAGIHLLEAEGMRAMLPAEVPIAADVTGTSHVPLERTVSLVTLNVDGLGEYRRTPAKRMSIILEQLLLVAPDVIHLQEAT